MSTTIQVDEIGPVTEFELKLSEPGLFMLRGKHGSGKTIVLRTVDLIVGGRAVKARKADGAKAGTASVGDRAIRVTKRTTTTGELGVEGLGDFDIAKLHSPGFNDATTRDAYRTKALLRMAGVSADATLFHKTVGGPEAFQAIVADTAIDPDDLVDMAEGIKRCVMRAAKAAEEQLLTAQANYRAQADVCKGVDLEAPRDATKLHDEFTAAIEHRSALIQKQKGARDVKNRAADARNSIEAKTSHLSVSDAELRLAESRADVDAAEQAVSDAKTALTQANSRVEADRSDVESARDHAELMSTWEADIAAAEATECPTDADIEAAEKRQTDAADAAEYGVKVHAAIDARAGADGFLEEIEVHETQAKQLREAAGNVFDVLSEAIASIPNCPLISRNDDNGNPRLVLATDRSEYEPFDELSSTEKWLPLLDLAGGPNRLIVLPQEAFSEMNESTRRWLHEQAVKRECYILTALADEGELRGESYADRSAAVQA